MPFLLGACSEPTSYDRDGDGIDDFFTETDEEFYYELYDNDFDGNVDERWKYSLNYVLISAWLDHDFDGELESEYISDGIYFTDVFTDSNGNGIPDIYTKYENGTGVYAERYQALSRDGRGRVGRVEYNLGYPSDESVSIVSLTEEEFAQQKRDGAWSY